MARLGQSFYAKPTLIVAKEMLGKYLIFQGKVGKIVETEGYLGREDLGSHARSGLTPRNNLMFGPPGFVYVYMTYGLHFMLNITTEVDGVAGAVLIRALEPISGIDRRTHGPGRLTRALGINLSHQGLDITGQTIYLESRGDKIGEVTETTRVGIDYAGEFAKKPWRFFLKGNKFVSKL